MQNKTLRHLISFIVCCFIVCILPARAEKATEWLERVKAIRVDSVLADSVKVVQISEVTYNYYYYHQAIGVNQLEDFLNISLPLTENGYTDDGKIHVYSVALFLSRDTERAEEIEKKCIYYTERGYDPLIRFLGWIRLGQINIYNSASLEYFLKAYDEVKYTEEYTLQSQAYRFAAIYYRSQQDAANGIKYAKQALEFANLSGNMRTLGNSWTELAYNYYEALDSIYWDDTLEAFQNVRHIYRDYILKDESDPDRLYADRIHYTVILVNMGLFVYDRGEFDLATSFLTDALQMATNAGITETVAFCHKQLGLVCEQRKQYRKALHHYDKAESALSGDYFRSEESDHLEYELLFARGSVYRKLGDYIRSVSCYRKGVEKYIEVLEGEITIENQVLAARYETSRHEEELKQMETIVAYRDRQWNYRIGIIALLIVGLVIVTFTYKYKLKLAIQHEQRVRDEAHILKLESEKAELATQIKAKETEELKHKLGQSNHLVEMRNATLNNLRTFFAAHSELSGYKTRIEAIIFQQNRVEGNVKEFKSGIQDVPPDFNAHLQKLANNRLTALDLKYCRLIFLGTSIREMAELLFVDPKTVKVTKFRLKRKFNLDKEDDLNCFIQNIDKND